jgi:hypothetical protein
LGDMVPKRGPFGGLESCEPAGHSRLQPLSPLEVARP